jgi:hypothetical protein
MPLGPVQLIVIGFNRPDFSGELLAELERLRKSENESIRVIDLLVVRRGADGVVQRLHHADLTAGEAGVIGALIGLDAADEMAEPHTPFGATRAGAEGGRFAAEEDFWSLEEAIPNDSAAAIALIEHRWAIGTRDAIRAAGGVAVTDAWIHPADLLAAGLSDAEDAATPD